MDKSRQNRLIRIKKIDEKKLDEVSSELKKLSQIMEERRKIRSNLQTELDDALSNRGNVRSITLMNQAMSWVINTTEVLADLSEHLSTLEEKQTELLDKARQQRGRVKGWELLLEKIAKEQLVAAEKAAIYTADDRHLSKTTTRIRS